MEDGMLIKLIKEDAEEGMKEDMVCYSPLVKAIVIRLMEQGSPEDVAAVKLNHVEIKVD